MPWELFDFPAHTGILRVPLCIDFEKKEFLYWDLSHYLTRHVPSTKVTSQISTADRFVTRALPEKVNSHLLDTITFSEHDTLMQAAWLLRKFKKADFS